MKGERKDDAESIQKLLMSIGLQRNEDDFAVRLFIGAHWGDERRHANIFQTYDGLWETFQWVMRTPVDQLPKITLVEE